MARIRTIKPEFPQAESMGRVSRDARLAFVLLWTLADDAGRLRGNPRMLASLLYPYDNDAPSLIDGWLAELEAERCVQRYAAAGQHYIQVVNWLEHQKIDKPTRSKLPGPDGTLAPPDANPRETSAVDQGGDQGVDRDQGRDGDQGRERKAAAPAPAAARPLPDDFAATPAHHQLAAALGLCLPTETAKFCDYYRATGKTLKDWSAAFNNWLRKAQRFGDAHAPRHPARRRPDPADRRADALARLTGQPATEPHPDARLVEGTANWVD